MGTRTFQTTFTAAPLTASTALPQYEGTTERLSADTRRRLLQGVSEADLSDLARLSLSPGQKLAIAQELEYQQLGLPAFTDPTPWQRLSRDQQLEFNRKYLALPTHLQEYSRNQFLSLSDARQEKAYNTFVSVDIETLTRAIEREFSRERAALERRTQEERRREEENIHRLLDAKRMEYSAMNAEIVTDILDNSIDSGGSDLIKILKQQLSNSLQVALDSDDEQPDQIVVTTGLPEQSRSQVPLPSNIKFHRLNNIDPGEEYLSLGTSDVKSSPRVPKSNSSILSARASLFARRFQSKSPSKISEETRRSNLARLMYDPRRKF